MDKKHYWGVTLLDEEGNRIRVRVTAEDREKAEAAILTAAQDLAEVAHEYDPEEVGVGRWFSEVGDNGNGTMISLVTRDEEKAQQAVLDAVNALCDCVQKSDPKRGRRGYFFELARNQEPPELFWPLGS